MIIDILKIFAIIMLIIIGVYIIALVVINIYKAIAEEIKKR